MKLRYSVTTHAKLRMIWMQLLMANPFAARRLRQEVARALGRLRTFPRMGSRVAEFPAAPIRQIIIEPYRFFYTIDDRNQTVWIVDVWHGAQIPAEPKLPHAGAEP